MNRKSGLNRTGKAHLHNALHDTNLPCSALFSFYKNETLNTIRTQHAFSPSPLCKFTFGDLVRSKAGGECALSNNEASFADAGPTVEPGRLWLMISLKTLMLPVCALAR